MIRWDYPKTCQGFDLLRRKPLMSTTGKKFVAKNWHNLSRIFQFGRWKTQGKDLLSLLMNLLRTRNCPKKSSRFFVENSWIPESVWSLHPLIPVLWICSIRQPRQTTRAMIQIILGSNYARSYRHMYLLRQFGTQFRISENRLGPFSNCASSHGLFSLLQLPIKSEISRSNQRLKWNHFSTACVMIWLE